VSDPYKRPYVESSVFVAFIKGEMQGPNQDQDAKKIFDSIIEAAKAGLFKIVTSSLTIAEVFKNKKAPELSSQQNEDLRPYFREDYIVIVEADREVGERANELCRTLQADAQHGFKAMRPNDAIHIASAERAECDVVLAWDMQFVSQNERLKTIKLENPVHVTFTVPAQQDEMFKIGAPSELAQQQLQQAAESKAIAGPQETLQLVGHVEQDNKTGEVIENPVAVRGDDGERVVGEAGAEAPEPETTQKAEDKVKGPDGVQSQPTP
jgi:predicted nucleic acid-binding protein